MSKGHQYSVSPGMLRRRQSVRDVACPKCGAAPHVKCLGARGYVRAASHTERWKNWRLKG